MKYTIKAFSEKIGLTPDTLRLYEKYGVVEPKKDENNGYRYYDDFDVRELLSCRRYRSLDFPLDQAAKLSLGIEKSDYQTTLQNQVEHITSELKRLEQVQKQLQKLNRIIGSSQIYKLSDFNLPNIPFEPEKVTQGALYRMIQTDENLLIDEVEDIAFWMSQLPEVSYSFKLSSDDPSHFDWGIAITEEMLNLYPHKCITSFDVIPASDTLKMYALSNQTNFDFNAIIKRFEIYTEQFGYVSKNLLWGRILGNYVEHNERFTLLEIYYQVNPTED